MAQTQKTKVAILGATGMVGQRFVKLLENHPQFQVTALCASAQSAGKEYSNACKWIIEGEMPAYAREMNVLECSSVQVKRAGGAQLAFSSLPADVAKIVEPEFAKAGIAVVSKASAYRMEPDFPLIVPEVNPQHLALIDKQRKTRGWTGFVSTDPNCSTIQLVMALAPLHAKFKIKRAFVSTMQALSGAGYPGVQSLDISDNVIPFISGEEDKVETEPLKILGNLSTGKILEEKIQIQANCSRVNVSEGHLESVFLEFEKLATEKEVIRVLEEFEGEPQKLKLFSAPKKPIIVMRENDRPQPRRDRNAEGGMAVSVGRIRCNGNTCRMFVLGHNTLRGAAGNGVLHAELLLAKKYI